MTEKRRNIMMAHMSWREYLQRVKDEYVFLPVGATEQHGPHLPLGVDALSIMDFTKDIVEKLGSGIIAPVISYGCKSQPYSGGGQLFPTTSISGITMIMLVKDILLEFLRHGAKKIVVLDGHFENRTFLTEAIDLALKEYGKKDVRIIKACPPEFIDPSLYDIFWPDGFPGIELEHAALIETSLMLYYHPELVNMEKIEPLEDIIFPKYEVFPLFEKQVPTCGCLADPSRGSYEYGKMMVDSLVENCAAAIKEAYDQWEEQI